MKISKHGLLIVLMLLTAVTLLAQDSNRKLFTLYAKNGMSAQSAACHGDYLILVTKLVSKMGLYNLNTKKLLCTRQLQPWTELRGKTDIFHANNSGFLCSACLINEDNNIYILSSNCNTFG